MDELKDIARNLRRLPVVDLSGATVRAWGVNRGLKRCRGPSGRCLRCWTQGPVPVPFPIAKPN